MPLPAILAVLVLGVAALALAIRAWRRTHHHHGHPRPCLASLPADQRGTATLEFALVFPIVLGLTLLLLQTALVMTGQLFVHYAAFAATRSAIVYIPSDQSDQFGEPRNTIVPAPGDPKFDAIRRAAIIAVMPVSGELETEASDDVPIDTAGITAGLTYYFQSHGRSVPGWAQQRVVDRMRYAQAHTDVTLMRTSADSREVWFEPLHPHGQYTFGPRDPVTVRVEHRFNLSIPYARAAFADGRHTTGDAYTNVSAQYTLTNEGIDPALPDAPDLPRSDQMDEDE